MDVVASVGYVGQPLFFIDEERFAHTTGKGIYIYDTHKGPREIIWRHEKDMLYCSVNLEAQLLAFSFKAADQTLELVKLTDISNPIQVENPFKCAIIHHEINRSGDRLYGLSDVTDQNFIIWSVSKQPKILATKKLEEPVSKCLINPCDSDQVCLYGNEGIYLSQVHEVFGDYSLKIQKVYPPATKEAQFAHHTDDGLLIKFVMWLPFHRLLIALQNGDLLELNTETKVHKTLGKFYDFNQKGNPSGGLLIGSTAVITSNYFILGTNDGYVYWFHLHNYLNDPNSSQAFIDEFKNPFRVAKCDSCISSLTLDPSYGVLIIGSVQGIITKAPVEPEIHEEVNNNQNDGNEENDKQKEAKPTCEQVNAETVGTNNSMNGLIFNSKFLTMNVKKVTTRAKSSLSLCLLGFHHGHLHLWRQNESVGDMIISGAPIRRSNPKGLQDLLRIETKSQCAITNLEIVQYGYFYILVIGFENGFLEFWSLHAIEHDDEEAKEAGNNNNSNTNSTTNLLSSTSYSSNGNEYSRFIEDDEGTCIVKLEFTYLMKSKIFNSAFTNFTLITTESPLATHNNPNAPVTLDYKLAVTGMNDPQLYVLHLIRNNRLEIGKIFDLYDISQMRNSFLATDPNSVAKANSLTPKGPSGTIHSLLWMDESLFSFVNNANNETLILRHKLDLENNKIITDSSSMRLSGNGINQPLVRVFLSPLSNAAIGITTNGLGYYISLSDDVKSRIVWEKYKIRRLMELKDLVSYIQFAPSGNLFATGSIDGNLTIWKIDPDNYENIGIIHSVSIFSSPFLNINFSLTSNSLFASSLDGTSLILFLGRFVNKPTIQKQSSVPGNVKDTASPAKPVSNQIFVQQAQQLQNLMEKQQQSLYHVDTLDLKNVTAGNPIASSNNNTNTAVAVQNLAAQQPSAPGMINPEEILLADKLAIEKEKELKAQYKFKAMGITAAINEIKQRLSLLIEQNNARTELEQLTLSEFVLDLKKKLAIEEANQKKIDNLHQSYFHRIKCLELLAARLKKFTFDTIAIQSSRIRPFIAKPEIDVTYDPDGVSSYPILKVSSDKQTIIDKIKRLRRLEIRTMRRCNDAIVKRIKGTEFYRCAWIANIKGVPIDINYLMNEGSLWPCTQSWEVTVGQESLEDAQNKEKEAAAAAAGTATTAGKEGGKGGAPPAAAAANPAAPAAATGGGIPSHDENDEEGSFHDGEEEQEIDETNILNLFYSPLTTRSIIQKRNQILFIQEILVKEKVKFNTIFKTLATEKEDTVNNILSRLERMKEILLELQIDPKTNNDYQLFAPLSSLFDDEIPGSEFKVKDSDLISKPYENEAMRLAKQKELEEKLKKMANNENEILKERALQDMMFGTLEMKKNLLLNEDLLLSKPQFLIDNPSMAITEMNENQLKEYENYQNKLKQIQEEQLHYKKTLEQENKKLKLEMIEIIKTFNEKLGHLITKKLLCNKILLANEMYISRIALTMVKAESYQSLLKKNDTSLLSLRKERNELKGKLENYHKHYEEMKNKLFLLQEEEKNMDKSFKRDLQNLCNNTFDIETLKVFTDLYRKRMYPKSSLSSSLGGDGDDGFANHSESMDISMSHSQTKNQSGATNNNNNNNGTAIGKGGKKGGGGGDKLGSTKTSNSGNNSRGGDRSRKAEKGGAGGGNRRLKASRGINASKETSSNNMGPMQQAAQALLKSAAAAAANGGNVIPTNHLYENEMIIAREKDPFYNSLLSVLKKKKKNEVILPLQNPLSMELDCPEGFTVDQFSWLKLQELRTQRIEKEIERSLLMNECNIVKTKLYSLDNDEISLSTVISNLRALRDNYREELKNMDINLDLLINLLQGQDEMNQDAIITEYQHGLLIPITIINKYNNKIKELGLEKINILTKIKLFRRKMNLISWEAIHNGLQLKHFENYYTDLQLFRVTRDLQKVILEGENAFNQKERVEKISSRREFLTKDYIHKKTTLLSQIEHYDKLISEKQTELHQLFNKINELNRDVTLSKSIKESKEGKFHHTFGGMTMNGGGDDHEDNHDGGHGTSSANEDFIKKKMKKIMNRRRMVDIARTQAEEIDFLRQELDRMRQRTFPSFVKATKDRVNAMF